MDKVERFSPKVDFNDYPPEVSKVCAVFYDKILQESRTFKRLSLNIIDDEIKAQVVEYCKTENLTNIVAEYLNQYSRQFLRLGYLVWSLYANFRPD